MRMKTEYDKHVAGLSRLQYSDKQSAENGNRTEKKQHGPAAILPNVGITNDTGKNCNKRFRWIKEEMK